MEMLTVTQDQAPTKRVKIAWLSPFPPQPSGVANYSYRLIKSLSSDIDIHLFGDREQIISELVNHFTVHSVSAFPDRYSEFDDVIYHLGNHAGFHKHIYELAWNFPGTVVLHDYDLSGFMHEAFLKSNNDLYFDARPNAHSGIGRRTVDALMRKTITRGHHDPMSEAIVNRSKKVIVHHRWVRDQFENPQHIEVIPHFAELNHQSTSSELADYRRRFEINPDHFLLVCAGFVNNNKLPNLQIRVAERLIAAGYPVQLMFAGAVASDVRLVTDNLKAKVIITGYLEETDYFNAIAAADVILNLRNPSMGEASGTLMHALAAGSAVVVSDSNQYKEFPDKVCWKLKHDEHEEDLLFEYVRTLLENVTVRNALSRNSAEYARSVLSLKAVSNRWMDVLRHPRR